MGGSIVRAQQLGQSIWLDNLGRGLIRSGELERLRDSGVTGITSNPTIFQKSVAGEDVYDDAIRELTSRGESPQDMVWDLIVEDVSAAADIFRPVYERAGRRDGFVSIEVSPSLAHDTDATVAMAADLEQRCHRPNVMVKIPATREGVPAIRRRIGEDANINVTLIFAVRRYEEVVEAFLSGLEDLLDRGGDVSQVNSVASFFVSRVDTKVDARIDALQQSGADGGMARRLDALRGTIGIANSKMAYQRFLALHSGARWDRLADAGAVPQRCLWASTSVKNPRYPDTLYADNLIGAQTVDTMPETTLDAFVDHGEVRDTLCEGVEEAEHQLAELRACGIDLDAITDELETEGVAIFAKSYEELTASLADAARRLGARASSPNRG